MRRLFIGRAHFVVRGAAHHEFTTRNKLPGYSICINNVGAVVIVVIIVIVVVIIIVIVIVIIVIVIIVA